MFKAVKHRLKEEVNMNRYIKRSADNGQGKHIHSQHRSNRRTKKAYANVVFTLIVAVSVLSFNTAALASDSISVNPRPNVLISRISELQLASGVKLSRHNEFSLKGLTQYSVLEVTLTDSSIEVKPVLSKGVLTSPSTVSKIVEQNGLIAGTNGDFFDIGNSSSPLSTLIVDNELIRSPRVDPDFSTLAILESGRAFIEDVTSAGVLRGPDGVSVKLNAYNDITIPANGAVIFDTNWPLGTHKLSYSSWMNGQEVTVVLVDDQGYVLDVKTGPFTSADLSVSSFPFVLSAQTEVVSEDGSVSSDELLLVGSPKYEIVARGTSAQSASLLKPGDSVNISYGIMEFIPGIETAFSGKPVLVSNGKKLSGLNNYTSIQGNTVAPRTAVGISEDRDVLYIVVVDGRLSGARGMTLDELADLMISLGCQEALNLDGGGSSMLAYKNPVTQEYEVSNRVLGSERAVPYVIGVMYSDDADLSEEKIENLSVKLKAYAVEREADGSYKVVESLGEYPDMASALPGGVDSLMGGEKFVKEGRDILLLADVYDANENLIKPSGENGITLNWELSGAGSEGASVVLPANNGSAAIVSPSKNGGKMNISAYLTHNSGGLEADGTAAFYRPSAELDVRVLGQCSFIEISRIEGQDIVEDVDIPFTVKAYDEFGFAIPSDMLDFEVNIFSEDHQTSVDGFYIPYEYLTSPVESFLQISADDALLTCRIQVNGDFMPLEIEGMSFVSEPEPEGSVENTPETDAVVEEAAELYELTTSLEEYEVEVPQGASAEDESVAEGDVDLDLGMDLDEMSFDYYGDEPFWGIQVFEVFSPKSVNVTPIELVFKSSGLDLGVERLKPYASMENPKSDSAASVAVDMSKGGIQSTNSAQWQKIADAMNVRDEDGNVDLTITLTGKPLMRQDGTYETSYATATDVTLFRELLSFLSNGRMSSITVIQSAGTTDSAPVYMMKDGVKWVWIP